MKRLVALAALSMAIAGCGGGGDSYSDAQAVADAAQLTECKPDPEVISDDAVACEEARANWFKSDDTLSGWRKIADQFPANAELIVYGSNWAIECYDAKACEAIRARME